MQEKNKKILIFLPSYTSSLKSNIQMDISKAVQTYQGQKTKRMDFSELYTMMGQYLKESIKMVSDMAGVDISAKMDISVKKIITIDN